MQPPFGCPYLLLMEWWQSSLSGRKVTFIVHWARQETRHTHARHVIDVTCTHVRVCVIAFPSWWLQYSQEHPELRRAGLRPCHLFVKKTAGHQSPTSTDLAQGKVLALFWVLSEEIENILKSSFESGLSAKICIHIEVSCSILHS